jgi:FkbM family methyltransferase
MEAIKDRHGRAVDVALVDAGGARRRLGARDIAAALKLRRALGHKPELCAKGLQKLLGLVPARLELVLWNRKKLVFNVPADASGFIFDIDCVILRDQYCAAAVRGGAVVDAGANLGVFTLYALALGAKKVAAFEPVPETCAMLKANLALNRAAGKVKVFNLALGRAKGSATLFYNTRGEGSATIAPGGGGRGITYAEKKAVQVAPLGALLRGRADFIKLDVEGSEADVLLGAAQLIKKYKPVLSLAAYHKAGDRRELPRVVNSIRPGYDITFNSFAENDLYCR